MAKIKKGVISKKSTKINQSFAKKDKKKSHIVKISTPISRINHKIISKKEKQKLKKQKVLEGIKNTKRKFAEEKARIKREKTVITGDLKPLLDSLPTLDELMTIRDSKWQNITSSADRKNATRKPKNKFERRKMLINEKTETFYDRFDAIQKVWKDPKFQKNPRQLIAERIKNRNENEMEN